MRLIDANKLIKLINEQKEKETGAYTKGVNNGLNIAKSIINDKKQTPTAYDVDKVVEELKEVHKNFCTSVTCGGKAMCKDCEEYVMFQKNIEIVKQGSVSDDVCEYRITDKVVYASCNNKQIASAFCWFDECGDYKYCPYCGKRIKVEE